MDLVERTIIACGECGRFGLGFHRSSSVMLGRRCSYLNCDGFMVEFVPAADSQGAVEALRVIAGPWDEGTMPKTVARRALEAMGVDPRHAGGQ